MTTVDATISGEDGLRIRLGGGLFGQASALFWKFSQAVETGLAQGEVGPSWGDGSVSGEVLLRMLEGIGDVPASPLSGVPALSESDLLSAIQPDQTYGLSFVEF